MVPTYPFWFDEESTAQPSLTSAKPLTGRPGVTGQTVLLEISNIPPGTQAPDVTATFNTTEATVLHMIPGTTYGSTPSCQVVVAVPSNLPLGMARVSVAIRHAGKTGSYSKGGNAGIIDTNTPYSLFSVPPESQLPVYSVLTQGAAHSFDYLVSDPAMRLEAALKLS